MKIHQLPTAHGKPYNNLMCISQQEIPECLAQRLLAGCCRSSIVCSRFSTSLPAPSRACVYTVLPLTRSTNQRLPKKVYSANKPRIHEPRHLILSYNKPRIILEMFPISYYSSLFFEKHVYNSTWGCKSGFAYKSCKQRGTAIFRKLTSWLLPRP